MAEVTEGDAVACCRRNGSGVRWKHGGGHPVFLSHIKKVKFLTCFHDNTMSLDSAPAPGSQTC